MKSTIGVPQVNILRDDAVCFAYSLATFVLGILKIVCLLTAYELAKEAIRRYRRYKLTMAIIRHEYLLKRVIFSSYLPNSYCCYSGRAGRHVPGQLSDSCCGYNFFAPSLFSIPTSDQDLMRLNNYLRRLQFYCKETVLLRDKEILQRLRREDMRLRRLNDEFWTNQRQIPRDSDDLALPSTSHLPRDDNRFNYSNCSKRDTFLLLLLLLSSYPLNERVVRATRSSKYPPKAPEQLFTTRKPISRNYRSVKEEITQWNGNRGKGTSEIEELLRAPRIYDAVREQVAKSKLSRLTYSEMCCIHTKPPKK